MQIVQDTTKAITNIDNESQVFGIKDMALVMQILTKMYSNPKQTITQEYISNARDANREVRSVRPIEITAPGRFNATMIIRDFGPGLSPQRIKDVFLFYGSSTKRNTNTQTGGFGIGGKSAWAYTESFTISTWFEGTKRIYVAHKSNGNGNLDLISEEQSTEPTGTAIEIAVNPLDILSFKAAILRTVFFWAEHEKPVLKGFSEQDMQAMQIKPVFEKFKEFKLYNTLPSFIQNKSAIIDGIPYPIRIPLDKTFAINNKEFVIILNTGDVQIAPNREEIVDDKQSREFFKKIDDTIHAKITQHVEKELEKNKTLQDGIKNHVKLFEYWKLPVVYIKDKYRLGSNSFSLCEKLKGNTVKLYVGNKYYYRYTTLKRQSCDEIASFYIDHLYYDDMPAEAATKKVWRIRKMLNTPGVGSMFYLIDAEHKEFIKDVQAKPLSSIDASDYKVARQEKPAVKKLEVCCHFVKNNGKLVPTQITLAEVKDTIVYADMKHNLYLTKNSAATQSIFDYLEDKKQNVKFAFISEAYFSKIKNNINFVPYDDYIKKQVPTKEQIQFALKGEISYTFDWLRHLKNVKAELTDSNLKYMCDVLNLASAFYPKVLIDKQDPIKLEFYTQQQQANTIWDRYPLLNALLRDFPEVLKDKKNIKNFEKDLINYLNQKHKENKKAGIL